MSALIRTRSRLYSLIWKNNRRLSSTVSNELSREPVVPSSVLTDQAPRLPNGPPPSADGGKNAWRFLKYGAVAAFTVGVATAGYATYG